MRNCRLILVLTFLYFLDGLQAQIGKVAPDFTVTDVNGNTHRLYDYIENGKKVIIDFFFTTCGPCIYYAPQVNKAYEKYGCNKQDLIFITIDYDDTDAEVIAYDKMYDIHFPSISGKNGGGNAVVSQYGIQAFPTFYLIDSTKKIVDIFDPPTLVVFDFKLAQHSIFPKSCLTKSSVVLKDNISIFQNPVSNGVLKLDLGNLKSGYIQLEFVDLNGLTRLGKKMDINGESILQIPIHELNVGQYIIKVTDQNEIIYLKLMVI